MGEENAAYPIVRLHKDESAGDQPSPAPRMAKLTFDAISHSLPVEADQTLIGDPMGDATT